MTALTEITGYIYCHKTDSTIMTGQYPLFCLQNSPIYTIVSQIIRLPPYSHSPKNHTVTKWEGGKYGNKHTTKMPVYKLVIQFFYYLVLLYGMVQ